MFPKKLNSHTQKFSKIVILPMLALKGKVPSRTAKRLQEKQGTFRFRKIELDKNCYFFNIFNNLRNKLKSTSTGREGERGRGGGGGGA